MIKRGFYFARKMESGEPVKENGVEVVAYPDAQIPEYQTKKSAGADFFCAKEVIIPSIWKQMVRVIAPVGCSVVLKSNIEGDEHTIQPSMVHTGIKASMHEDEVLELYNRSSNPKKLGLVLANSVGVVDADYFENADNDGEIMFGFYNFFPWDVTLKVGDRIGQGVFKKFLRPEENCRVKNEVRMGGFGSTN